MTAAQKAVPPSVAMLCRSLFKYHGLDCRTTLDSSLTGSAEARPNWSLSGIRYLKNRAEGTQGNWVRGYSQLRDWQAHYFRRVALSCHQLLYKRPEYFRALDLHRANGAGMAGVVLRD